MSEACEIPKLRYDSASYTPYPHSVRLARRRVAERVATWGYPAVARDAALVASELATNALLHGRLGDRLFRVEVGVDAGTVRVAVTDPRGERRPEVREAAGAFGRGLVVVRVLARRWDVEPLVVGKTVWAELDMRNARLGTASSPTGRFT